MKVLKYKILAILLLVGISLQAQTYDRKINEKFKVNSDATLEINANQTDVIVETWNKNEISIEAVMEVEGASKEEANKILSKWKFEALGNKSIVKVMSNSESMNFDFDFPEMDFDIPEIDFIMPELPKIPVLPELPEMPELPELPEMEEIEFNYQAYKSDSTYLKRYKEQVSIQVEKFKNSGWKQKMDSVRNSDEYKQSMEEIKRASKEVAREMRELQNSDEFKQAMEASKLAAEEVRREMLENKEVWKEQVVFAKEAAQQAMIVVREMQENGTFDSIQNFSENIYFNYGDHKNSKIKIKKYIKIKVPKNATFDLNVRHGKLNIPDSNKKMSATISYGDFIGGIITGDHNKLIISNSPVVINRLQSTTITLKNVPNATFGTVENVNLFSDYSDVIIETIGKNTALSNKFGNIEISGSVANFEQLNLILDYSKAVVDLSNTAYNYQISSKKSGLNLNKNLKQLANKTKDDVNMIEGFNKNKVSSNKLFLTSVFSSVKLN